MASKRLAIADILSVDVGSTAQSRPQTEVMFRRSYLRYSHLESADRTSEAARVRDLEHQFDHISLSHKHCPKV
jgi:hypothetical protein